MKWTTLLIPMMVIFGDKGAGPVALDPPAKPKKQLSRAEEESIRTLVFKKKLTLTTAQDGKWAGHRIVALDEKLTTTYKEKRHATLCFLLDIVKGARADDAILAIALAYALEQNPVAGERWVYFSPSLLDFSKRRSEPSMRENVCKWLERAIER